MLRNAVGCGGCKLSRKKRISKVYSSMLLAFREGGLGSNYQEESITQHLNGLIDAVGVLGEGGTIYFGLRKIPAPISTRVRGIKASRDQRDSFRMGVDKDVMGNISPTVTATYYDITFVPVVTATPTSEEAAVLSDLFVIGQLHPDLEIFYSTVNQSSININISVA